MRIVATRCLDELGRIVLPQELKRELDIENNSSIDIYVDENRQIILKKSEVKCKICGSTEDLKKIQSKNVAVCLNCQREIIGLINK